MVGLAVQELFNQFSTHVTKQIRPIFKHIVSMANTEFVWLDSVYKHEIKQLEAKIDTITANQNAEVAKAKVSQPPRFSGAKDSIGGKE